MSRTLYVTDAGSVSIAGRLFLPSQQIPIDMFAGREASLRELIQTGKVSQRKRRMRSDENGRVIKLDRSSGAAPLPSEISQYDDKKRREIKPLHSTLVGNNEVAGALVALQREQQSKELQKADEDEKIRAEVERQQAEEEKVVSEGELKDLSALVDDASDDDDDGFDDPDSDELLDDDVELLDELASASGE